MATKKKPTTTKDKPDKVSKGLKPAEMRFVLLYLGGEDGKCFNSAVKAYIVAFEIDTPLKKVKLEDGREDYTQQYKTAKSLASRLLTNSNILAFRDKILLEQGFDPSTIKKRFAELAYQNHNLPIAHAATRDMAKLTNMITDDKKVDIPQLEELGNAIKQILTPKKT